MEDAIKDSSTHKQPGLMYASGVMLVLVKVISIITIGVLLGVLISFDDVSASFNQFSPMIQTSALTYNTFDQQPKPVRSHLDSLTSKDLALLTDLPFHELDCPTPMSLMLHSSFGVLRMEELAQELIENNIQTTTYQEIMEGMLDGLCPDPYSIIVSLDDLGTHWLRPDFKKLIKIFTDKGLKLVAGVVVYGPQNPSIWAYFRELQVLGIEVASHTVNHANLPLLDEETLNTEVTGSYQIICENLGQCPVTLILPFGYLDDDNRILDAASDYFFVLGIQGGYSFGGIPPYYLGRIPPDNTYQSITLQLLGNTFLRRSIRNIN